MRSNAPLRILYAAGPGHVIGTYDHWKKGQDDPSQISITFSSQFFEVCKALNATAYIISSCGQREVRQDGAFRLEHRPNPLSQASGLLYHSGQLAYGLGLVVSALRFRANVVIADTGSTYWFVLSILSWMGVHVIPSLHCVLWRKYAPQRRLETILLSLSRRLFAKDCRAILAVSREVSEQVKVLTRGQARPIKHFLPTYRRSEFLNLAEPDLTIAPFRILFAGRIERNKGVFDLLAIAQRLIGEGHNLVFELCGDGTALQELREAAQKAGLSQTFLCHGYCQKQKLQERLSRSHLVIVPTRTEFVEGFNQVVAEGVLAGRPVITSSVCPAIAYVQEAVVEVPPNDVQAYGDAVLKLYRDRDFYQLKRRNCAKVQAQFYDSSYSWATTLHSLLLEIFPQRAVEPDPKLSISASSRL